MIILLSPQYAHDQNINNAINTYTTAVHDDIGWNTNIIQLTQDNNHYTTIDDIIESSYEHDHIKACIIVGEDTNTPCGGSHEYMRKPSTIPWYTIGEETAYETSDQGIVSKPQTMQICISLLYPTSTLSYEEKKQQLITAFTKFSTQRTNILGNIAVLESQAFTTSQTLYQDLTTYANVKYLADPSKNAIQESLTQPYSMFFVHGHSNPAGTDVTEGDEGWFSADNVDKIQSPLFGADGCYVNGWWTSQKDTTILEPSIDALWYGSKIFTSPTVKVMILGLLSQSGYDYPVSFLEQAIPELVEGKTLAESLIGHTFVGDNPIIIGDPTFHFSI